MNSIAIWYEPSNPDTKTEIGASMDIHINHWKLKANKNFFNKGIRALSTKTIGKLFPPFSYYDSDYFMDIGLKVKNGKTVNKICIYLPHIISDKKSIEDLGSKLESIRLLTAVFNEPLTINVTNNSKHLEVQKKGTPVFNIFKLSIDDDVNIESAYKGTILKFKHRNAEELPTYYRFRLKGGFLNNLSLTYTPSNFLFESAYSKIEVIDFRINDTRNLDVSLIEHIERNKKFKISLVHYFVMRNLRDEYIISNQELNGVRQLEKEVWSSYINEKEYHYEGSFAYHLKSKVSEVEIKDGKYIDDFAAVFKFRYEDSKLLLYIIGFLVIALLIELFGNIIYDYLNNHVQSLNQNNYK